MTELEQKAEEYAKNFIYTINESADDRCKKAYKDGYKQGEKDNHCLDCYVDYEKELSELQTKYDELNDFSNSQCAKLLKENAEFKKKIEELEFQNGIISKGNAKIIEIDNSLEIADLKEQIEKMKCCGNCGNTRCTSKYRGNSAYHRQSDGYACADNEDWIERS